MSTVHLLLKLSRLFSVNIEDETSPIHAWSTGQLQLRNAAFGLPENNPPLVNPAFLKAMLQDHDSMEVRASRHNQPAEVTTEYPNKHPNTRSHRDCDVDPGSVVYSWGDQEWSSWGSYHPEPVTTSKSSSLQKRPSLRHHAWV